MNLTIVICSGRCGSTLLSHILSEHPDVLSVSEFFGALKAAAPGPEFPSGDVGGAELWDMLARPHPGITELIRSGLVPPEMYYPVRSDRFDLTTGIPIAYYSLLPTLVDDPDTLFDHLAAQVPTWPVRPAAVQYRAFFAHLAARCGRHVIVERSAASAHLAPLLHRLFPDARYVHMHRDGPSCAMSMSRHPTFRREALVVAAMDKARSAGVSARSLAELEDRLPEFRGLLVPPYDADRFMAYPIPVTFFASRYWSVMEQVGMAELSGLPAAQWTGLRYEDLLESPDHVLTRLAKFLDVPAERSWLDRARAIIDPGRRRGPAHRLDPGMLDRVRAACEPGTRAIAEAYAAAG